MAPRHNKTGSSKSGSKTPGKGLFPFGPSGASQGHASVAYSLLRAAPFVLRGPIGNQILTWGEPGIAAQLLRVDPLPRTRDEFQSGLPPAVQGQRQRAMAGLTFDGARYSLTYRISGADAADIWIEESGERISGEGETPDHIIGVLRDVTEARHRREQIERDQKYDALTGCLNARYFQEILRAVQSVSPGAGQAPQVLRIALINAPTLEATYGPVALSYVFEAMAKRLSGELSPRDYAAFDDRRHFQILFAGSDAEQLLARSKKLKFMLGIPIESPFGTMTPDCRISIETPGIIETETDETTAADLGRTVPFAPRADITEMDILTALEDDRFALAFQPVQKAGIRKTEYYEALLRYTKDDGGMISAWPYIEAAEKLGLISRLDRRAFALARAAMRAHPSVKLSINVSAGTVTDDTAREAYLSDLATLGDRAKGVIIELTETMAFGNMDLANRFAARLQALGVRLAIDDFGAGHTSFQNLMGMEAHILKLDGSYIRDIARSPQKQNFVRLMAEMAQTFGLSTVAEMIDNEADCKMAERLGVDYLQGFYLGRPGAL